jgi:hypothetical protein
MYIVWACTEKHYDENLAETLDAYLRPAQRVYTQARHVVKVVGTSSYDGPSYLQNVSAGT